MQKFLIPIISVVLAAGIAFVITSAPRADEQPEKHASLARAKSVAVSDIAAHADNIPPPVAVARSEVTNRDVVVHLRATQVVAELDDGTTYEYWTYNDQVPGPFIRAMEGDTVEISLAHEHAHGALEDTKDTPELSFILDSFVPIALANGDDDHSDHADHEDESNAELDAHTAAGHGEHSIDLHAVIGPGGGAEVMRVAPNDTKSFRFKATRPGIYIYHCASPHVPTHIANGMYGMILVEPEGGLQPVDREFYVMQGEFYTTGKVGEKGHQEFDLEKLLMEHPEYVVFNGRMGALTGERALRAEVGEKVRIFFGVSGQLASNFHIIGEIFDNLYPEGDIVSAPRKNVQTTLVPGGGATMVEFTTEVPGTYLLVDHALGRAINRGAVGQLIVEE
jgi:nitrite reductase (NO-forming)